MLRQLTAALAVMVVGVIVSWGALGGYVLYVTWQIQDVQALATAVAVLRQNMEQELKKAKAEHETFKDELDELTRTLYAPTLDPQRRPLALERWMIQRDDALRKRIAAIEQWRYRVDP